MDNQPVPIIGKDVIESLTLGMYEDSLFIFREYIQNAADQIDKAVETGLLTNDEGDIHICIDEEAREITIEDNATGICSRDVLPVLQNIAQSTKRRGIDKGFRGIGRLGGLAYCTTLVFETTAHGEDVKSILTWDAALLKNIINNRKEKQEAAAVIHQVTKFETQPEEKEKHYFRIILKNVSVSELLDRKQIERYLSEVAPIPFATRFIFQSKVAEEAQALNIRLDEYRVFLNGDQLFKGYSTYIKKDDSQAPCDEVIDIVFFSETASDGQLLYWGWHSISEKNQSLNSVNFMRGFRLRKSNIQIGNEYTLLKLHRDRRFQFYFYGEVHAVHPELIPNARRDYFIENDICLEFNQKLQDYFHRDIHRLCYTASEINSSLKKIHELKELEDAYQQKRTTGFTDPKEKKEFHERFERKREEAVKAKSKIEKIQRDCVENVPVSRILNKIKSAVVTAAVDNAQLPPDEKRLRFRTDKLSSLSRDEQKFLGRIFSIIREVLEPQMAENVIQKIEEELK